MDNPFEIPQFDIQPLLDNAAKRYAFFAEKAAAAEAVALPKRSEWLKSLLDNVEPEDLSEVTDGMYEAETAEEVAALLLGLQEAVTAVKEHLIGWYFRQAGADTPEGIATPAQLAQWYEMILADFAGLKSHPQVTDNHLWDIYPTKLRKVKGGQEVIVYDGPKFRAPEVKPVTVRGNSTWCVIEVDGVTFPSVAKGLDFLKKSSKDMNAILAERGFKSQTDAYGVPLEVDGHVVRFLKSETKPK